MAQGLVLFVDAGKYAIEELDKIEEFDRADREAEEKEIAGIPDNMAMPEGMSLQEMSMGVIPPNA